jgi:Ca-activated chloride channel homolog
MQAFKLVIALSLTTALMGCIDQQNQAGSEHRQEQGAIESGTKQPISRTQESKKPNKLDDISVAEQLSAQAESNRSTAESAPAAMADAMATETAAHAERSVVSQDRFLNMKRAAPASIGFNGNVYPAHEPTDRENYQHFSENSVKRVTEDPVSTFSIDVDTAAYSNIRRMLNKEGRLPPSDAVKLEEMINYFNYDYEGPNSMDTPFSVITEMAPAPWNKHHQLLQIGLKGFEPPIEKRPDANLVFLVDVSGSMRSSDKLGLVKKSLRLLVNQMRASDRIALVVYAGAAGMVLDSTTADQKAKILSAIDSLESGGSTNGGAGIRLAYSVAQQHFISEGINRIVIASDGDMNVGTTNIDTLKNLIEEKRKGGVSLTTLGFGAGNYNYALMEQLADVGNGNAAYIDGLREAQKVLVEELQSTFLTIAKDVKIQIEFNPAIVAEYRLIGYENRLLNREDFRNDKVDAGDIGAGHTVTALYELTMVGSNAEMIAPKRYSSGAQNKKTLTDKDKQQEVAFVSLRYKKPQASNSIEFSTPILQNQIQPKLEAATQSLRFASAVAGFGQLLKGGKYMQNWGYDDVLQLVRSSKGNDEHGYRGELISLVELAKSLSMHGS